MNVLITSDRQPAVRQARPGECWSCPSRRPRNPAAYLWTAHPSGNKIPLCVECCAGWRRVAVNEPDLAPSRIQSLPLRSGGPD